MRKISWSAEARVNQLDILQFWERHNKSGVYSKKLRQEIKLATFAIAEQPDIGRLSSIDGIRMKLVRDHWIFYRYTDTTIYILQITGTQQNPESFYKELPQ